MCLLRRFRRVGRFALSQLRSFALGAIPRYGESEQCLLGCFGIRVCFCVGSVDPDVCFFAYLVLHLRIDDFAGLAPDEPRLVQFAAQIDHATKEEL